MSAGDNTLNAITALQTVKTMQKYDPDAQLEPKLLQAHVMENYVNFMTTPGDYGLLKCITDNYRIRVGHLLSLQNKMSYQVKPKHPHY